MEKGRFEREFTGLHRLASLAALVVFIGSILPWATFGDIGLAGTRGAGFAGETTLLTSVVVAVAAVAHALLFRWGSLIMVVCSVTALGISAFDLYDISATDAGGISVGYGLYATVAGSIIMAFASLRIFAADWPMYQRILDSRYKPDAKPDDKPDH